MRPISRLVGGPVAGLAAVLAIGIETVLATALWTMTMTPLTATVGVRTTFQFTATSSDTLLGMKCFIATIPDAINPGETWIMGSSTAAIWGASRNGQQVTVNIQGGDGNEKLEAGDWLTFAVAGVPLYAGSYAVPVTAYSNHGCSNDPRPLAAPPFVTIVDGASEPTPPSPTPLAPVKPTPTPKPSPTPLITVPSILPTVPPLAPVLPLPHATPRPAVRTPARAASTPEPAAPTPAPTPPPAASPVPVAQAARPTPPASDVATTPGSGESTPPASVLAVGRADRGGLGAADLTLGPLGIVDGLSVWAIPGTVVGGPGLLVILWVAIQAAATAAWIPAVGRMLGEGRRSRPSRGYATSGRL